MKVLHSIHSLKASVGGPARSVPALVTSLRNSGLDIRIVTQRLPEATTEQILSINQIDSLLSTGWRPDIIHDHGMWLPFNHRIATFSDKHHIPRMVSPRGMLAPLSLKQGRFKKRIAWLLYQRRDLAAAACLHATSTQEVQQFRDLKLGIPIAQIPNGVEALPLSEHPRANDASRALDPDRVREILFLSRIHPQKGLPLLVKAWKQVKKPGWVIRIVGPEERGHLTELKSLTRELNIEHEIIFDKPVNDSDKWELLANSDLVVLPSYSESFGMIVAEALAAGKPVITTTGTPWKSLNERHCGWCVPPDASSLALALQTAIRLTDEQRTRMGEQGRQWITSSFSWPAIAEQFLRVYECVLNPSQRTESSPLLPN